MYERVGGLHCQLDSRPGTRTNKTYSQGMPFATHLEQEGFALSHLTYSGVSRCFTCTLSERTLRLRHDLHVNALYLRPLASLLRVSEDIQVCSMCCTSCHELIFQGPQ